jgi:hypothetical protein
MDWIPNRILSMDLEFYIPNSESLETDCRKQYETNLSQSDLEILERNFPMDSSNKKNSIGQPVPKQT